jgi:hypothetical protein
MNIVFTCDFNVAAVFEPFMQLKNTWIFIGSPP